MDRARVAGMDGARVAEMDGDRARATGCAGSDGGLRRPPTPLMTATAPAEGSSPPILATIEAARLWRRS